MSGSWGTILRAPSRMTREDVERRRTKVRKAEGRIQRDALEEKQFLECVASNPGISFKEVCRELGIKNNSKGCDTRDVLEDRGFIRMVRRPPDKGKTRTCLSITQEGLDYLKELHQTTS